VKPILYVGNQNYSSWSLRPWLVLTWGNIDFETRVVQLGGPGYSKRLIPEVLAISPAGTVPVLHLGSDVIAIRLRSPNGRRSSVQRCGRTIPSRAAYARAAACEMHSGFSELRNRMPCNIRRRTEPRAMTEELRRDVERIEALWISLSSRFGAGGPYLFGKDPTITDAFYAPVATRFRT